MINRGSLSIYVPSKCNYSCGFCSYNSCLKKHDNIKSLPNVDELRKRMLYARNRGIDNLVITSYGEPILNKAYLKDIYNVNQSLPSPFLSIDFKTNGSKLVPKDIDTQEYNREEDNVVYLKSLGVTTVSIMLSSVWDDMQNNAYNNNNSLEDVTRIERLTKSIKDNGMNVRFNCMLTLWFQFKSLKDILDRCNMLGVGQVNLKVLQTPTDIPTVAEWLKSHSIDVKTLSLIKDEVLSNTIIGVTAHGHDVYSIEGISVVFDDGFVHDHDKKNSLFLLEDGKLYTEKDNKGSLLF